MAKVKGVSKTVQEDMARLRKTLTPDSDEDTEESSEDGEGGLPFPKTIGLLGPGAKGAITSKMGRAEAKEEGDASFRRPHDYDGARVGSRPKSRRPDAYDDDELHAEPADAARPQGAQVVGKKQRFHRPWWFQLRERQRQRWPSVEKG